MPNGSSKRTAWCNSGVTSSSGNSRSNSSWGSKSDRVNRALASIEIVPLSVDADSAYGKLRAGLEREGRMIGANDMLIAAHALAIDAILVTDNTAEFSRIPELRVENWLVRA